MDIGLGIRMIQPLAAQEAANGGAVEIELGHMLCAALKLAELPVEVFQNVLPDSSMVSVLVEEQRGLCATLNAMRIRVPDDSTLLRRSLRAAIIKSSRAPHARIDGVLHRSAACKALLTRVAADAQDAGDKFVAINRFIERILLEPDVVLADALTRVGIAPSISRSVIGHAGREWVNAYGADLTEEARKEGAVPARLDAIHRDAACRVLADALTVAPVSYALPLLLVSHGDRRVASVMRDLALWMVSANPPQGSRGGCMIELRADAILNNEGDLLLKLGDILAQAAIGPATILFFDDYQRYLTANPHPDTHWPRRMQLLFRESKSLCVLGMTSDQYKARVEGVDAWRNAFRIIAIHELKPEFKL